MGRPAINLIGQQFGRLTVIERAVSPDTKNAHWLCRCKCGNYKVTTRRALVRGDVQSCGCYQRERRAQGNTIHGGHGTRLYSIWRNMKERCYKPYAPKYPLYGGRGITVCDEWLHNFSAFRDWALSNGYQNDLTLDRIDNDEGYNPDNCRWATFSEQNRNRRHYHRNGGVRNG